MKRDIITTAIYYRKPTEAEISAGTPKRRKIFITIPVKDVFLGVDQLCTAILKQSILNNDGLRYYFMCVNYTENTSL